MAALLTNHGSQLKNRTPMSALQVRRNKGFPTVIRAGPIGASWRLRSAHPTLAMWSYAN